MGLGLALRRECCRLRPGPSQEALLPVERGPGPGDVLVERLPVSPSPSIVTELLNSVDGYSKNFFSWFFFPFLIDSINGCFKKSRKSTIWTSRSK